MSLVESSFENLALTIWQHLMQSAMPLLFPFETYWRALSSTIWISLQLLYFQENSLAIVFPHLQQSFKFRTTDSYRTICLSSSLLVQLQFSLLGSTVLVRNRIRSCGKVEWVTGIPRCMWHSLDAKCYESMRARQSKQV